MRSSEIELECKHPNFKRNAFPGGTSIAKKGLLIILISLFGYFLIITSDCWFPKLNSIPRSIRIINPKPRLWSANNVTAGKTAVLRLKNAVISHSSNPVSADGKAEEDHPVASLTIEKEGNSPTSDLNSSSARSASEVKHPVPESITPAVPLTTTNHRLKYNNAFILKILAASKIRLITLRTYKDCYLFFEKDVELMEEILSTLPNEVKVSKKTGLDPRLFHWNPSKHKSKVIKFRFTVRCSGEVMYLSVVYHRGNVDHIDEGYYWIPSFGMIGEAKAFSKFPLTANGHLYRPKNETKLEWEDQASKFKECNYTRVKKFYDTYGVNIATKETIEAFMRTTVHLRKVLMSWDVYNWISSGSLLGWFRQCSAIPYTTDADTTSWAYQYEDWMKNYFINNDTELHLWRKYGRKNDSLEFTFTAKGCRIDLFFMYEGVNPPTNNVMPRGENQRYNWVGMQTFQDYKKAKVIYPKFDRLCAADLHGYLVTIPCDALELVQAEYGPEEWFKPVKNFNWITSPNNVVIDGKWRPEDWDGGAVYEKHEKS